MLIRDMEDIFKLPNQTSKDEKIHYLRLKKKKYTEWNQQQVKHGRRKVY